MLSLSLLKGIEIMKFVAKLSIGTCVLAFASGAFAAGKGGAKPAEAKAPEKCDFTIEGNDSMMFNMKEMSAKGCKDVSVTLKHVGKLPVAAMGHNWVLIEAKNRDAVIKAATAAGPAKKYHLENHPMVIDTTKTIGGGESDTVKFSTAKMKAGGSYEFICTFPGHVGVMNGKFVF